MSNITQLTGAIRFALLAGAASILAAPAFAQDAQAEDETQTLDRVEVTGSRIRQVDLATPAPVLAITRADIEKQGFQSVADIIQQVSAFGTPTITRAQPLSAGEAAGGVFVSMRNLGAARTLVLVNGRRMGITTSGLADLATIPAAAVERIEILKDGASSLYGSDAIGGVVNIITVSDYEGLQASSYYGQYSEGDGETTRADMRLGFVGDRGSLTLAAEWAKEEKVKATDRFFSAFPRSSYHPTDNWTTVSQFGGFTTTAANQIPGVGAGVAVRLRPGGNPRNPADYVPINTTTGGCNFATGVCTVGSTADKTNTLEQTDLRTPLQSRGLFAAGTFDITDYVRFKTDFTYAYRDSERRVAGYPMQAAAFATPMAATSYFNPLGTTISNWTHRTFDIPRDSRSELTTYRFTGGFEGSLEFGDRYVDWDAAYVYNKNELLQSTFGNLNVSRTLQAVGPSFLNAQGQVQCGTAAAPIPFTQCVPWNPFIPAGTVAQGGIAGNTALQNFLFQEEHATGETSTEVITLNASGNIFALPAGDLMYAVGYENRKEEGAFVPDALAVTGNSTNLSSGPTRGGYKVDEFYVELQVPVLADMAFAKELSFQLASRYSDYNTFGDTTNDKFGLKWQPIEGVLIRGTIADGFRAPTIADLYGGTSQTFSFFTDPCDTNFGSSATNATTRANCARDLGTLANTFRQLGQGFNPAGAPNTQTPVAFSSGSNAFLQPETSRSKTLGVVWSPGFAEGLNLSLDWWNVRIENTIVADSPNDILNDCYVQGITSRCAQFTRDRTLGYVNNLSFGGRNAGYREIEGFDFDWTYRFELGEIGAFSIANNTTYTSKDIFVSTNDPRYPISSVGVAGSGSTTFRIRSNLNVGWEKGDWGVNWTTRYYSSIAEGCTYITECNQIQFAPTGTYIGGNPANGPASALRRRQVHGSNSFHDLQVRWNAPWNATIAVGANNVTDHYGPVMYSQPSANVPYYGGFDIGRFWYMKYSQRF